MERKYKEFGKRKKEYYVVGRVYESITKELLRTDNKPYIYVVTSNYGELIFCTLGSRVVYY